MWSFSIGCRILERREARASEENGNARPAPRSMSRARSPRLVGDGGVRRTWRVRDPPPLVPYSVDTPPLCSLPLPRRACRTSGGAFARSTAPYWRRGGRGVPDYRPCEDALTRIGSEPAGTGKPVDLGPSKRHLVAAVVAGIGYECFEQWLQPPGTVAQHVRQFGYDMLHAQGRCTVELGEQRAPDPRCDHGHAGRSAGAPRLVLVGYSKGAPDILEAVVAYPEIRRRVAAVVSAAGAVGGSALANDAEQYQADLLRHFPGATCGSGDGGGVESLRPATRRAWLARNPLPRELRYYSLVTFPQPERISSILTSSYDKLARIDARNDSQMIFYDQVIPGSTLVGYINADHWALAVPIARTHSTIGSMFVTQNAYPREALLEALLRFVEEDLATRPR